MNTEQLRELYFELDGKIRRLAMMGFDTTEYETEQEDVRLKLWEGN